MHVLAIDIGTSSIKATILDTASAKRPESVAHVRYALNHPTPEAAEIAPEEIWRAVTEAGREAVRHAGPQIRVEGVGLSCLTPALVLLDKHDQPLGPFWIHLDRRSRPVARQVWGGVGQEFLRTTGNRPLPGGMTVIDYRQQVNDDPYLTQLVNSYLHLNSWVGFRLTGVKAFESGNASFTGLYNTVTDGQWSQRWCDYFEVERGWLPDIIPGDATLGTLQSQPAAELNVAPGIPVKLGVPDTSSAMLFAGMTQDDLMHVVGTTQVLSVFADRPVPTPDHLTRRHGIGEQCVCVAHNPVGGEAFTWIKNLCFREQSDEEFFQQTVPEAGQRHTTVVLDPPYLGGDRLQIEAHRAAFRDLTLTTDRMDLLAALVRALVQGHRQALKALGRDYPFRRIFLTGGGADVVRQLIPEYADAPIQEFDDGSLRGIARLFG